MGDENRKNLPVREVASQLVALYERKPAAFDLIPGVLYLAGTPIGHLGDLSLRVGCALAQADLVLCEDTRVTRNLYSALKVEPPLLERFDASEERGARLDRAIEALKSGKRVVLVSDAGMPGVSDPGAFLVRRCQDEGIEVRGIPGPSALPTSMALSGATVQESRFLGFFPRDKKDRDQLVTRINANSVATQWIWFESPERVLGALARLAESFPHFRVTLCKELTKQYERVFSDGATVLAARMTELSDAELRGEWVVILEQPARVEVQESDALETTYSPILQAFRIAGVSASQAAKAVSQVFGAPKNQVYRLAIKIFEE